MLVKQCRFTWQAKAITYQNPTNRKILVHSSQRIPGIWKRNIWSNGKRLRTPFLKGGWQYHFYWVSLLLSITLLFIYYILYIIIIFIIYYYYYYYYLYIYFLFFFIEYFIEYQFIEYHFYVTWGWQYHFYRKNLKILTIKVILSPSCNTSFISTSESSNNPKASKQRWKSPPFDLVFSRKTWNLMIWDWLVQLSGKYCSIRRIEYPEFESGIFGRMESALELCIPLPLLLRTNNIHVIL